MESHTILQTITGGGPLILLIWLAILGTSIVMVTFIIQLFLALRDEQLAPKALLESLQATIRAGNYQEAWEICRANKAYIARVLKGALERIGRGKMPWKRLSSNMACEKRNSLERRTATSRWWESWPQ